MAATTETVKGVVKLINNVGRTFWNTVTGFLEDRNYADRYECRQVPQDKAILVGSLCEDGSHTPVLDIDFPAQLVPSTTPGHFHLYLDQKMSWERYKKLLEALYEAGIIQYGFYEMSLKRNQSMVLLPGIDRNKVTIGSRSYN